MTKSTGTELRLPSLFCSALIYLATSNSSFAAPSSVQKLYLTEQIKWHSQGSQRAIGLEGFSELPDLDGDSQPELLMFEADTQGLGLANIGRMVSTRTGNTLYTFQSPVIDDLFGIASLGIADIDNDGVPDFLVGAPGDQTLNTFGKVYVYSGQTGAQLTSLTLTGSQPGDFFGSHIFEIPDLTGDGKPEVLISSVLSPANCFASGFGPGKVQIFEGGTLQLLRQILPYDCTGSNLDLFGTSVVPVHDLDGDSLPDLAIGSPLYDTGTFSSFTEGRITLVSTGTGLTIGTPLLGLIYEQLGWFGSATGDINGDGYKDLAFGTNSVRLLSSSNLATINTIAAIPGTFVLDLEEVIDFTGDGKSEIIIARTPVGGGSGARAFLDIIDPASPGTPYVSFKGPVGSSSSGFGRLAVIKHSTSNTREQKIVIGASDEQYSSAITGTMRMYSINRSGISPVGAACGGSPISTTATRNGGTANLTVTGASPSSFGAILLSCTPELPMSIDPNCTIYLDPVYYVPVGFFLTDTSGRANSAVPVNSFSCDIPRYLNSRTLQVAVFSPSGAIELSKGLTYN